MYGGKNTLIVASVDRREACRHDVTLSKNLFFDSLRPPDDQAAFLTGMAVGKGPDTFLSKTGQTVLTAGSGHVIL